jgi:hypothetical protein
MPARARKFPPVGELVSKMVQMCCRRAISHPATLWRIRFHRSRPRSARGRWQDRTTPRSVPQREGRALSIAETVRRLRARGYVRALEPAGSTPADFAFVGCGDLLAFTLRPLVSRCDRFRRLGKSSGPPLFAPSLNVQGDVAHNSSGLAVI